MEDFDDLVPEPDKDGAVDMSQQGSVICLPRNRRTLPCGEHCWCAKPLGAKRRRAATLTLKKKKNYFR